MNPQSTHGAGGFHAASISRRARVDHL